MLFNNYYNLNTLHINLGEKPLLWLCIFGFNIADFSSSSSVHLSLRCSLRKLNNLASCAQKLLVGSGLWRALWKIWYLLSWLSFCSGPYLLPLSSLGSRCSSYTVTAKPTLLCCTLWLPCTAVSANSSVFGWFVELSWFECYICFLLGTWLI